MRDYFIELLTQEALDNREIVLITGDLGYGVLEGFEERFPEQFINAGVAEQNMMGVAAGLAYSGHKVFVYSIANFPTFRCLEQIRNDVAFHNLDVTIVAVGAGFSYGVLGYSHFAIEDIAAMRPLPGIKIFSPGTEAELSTVFGELISYGGPKYLRLDKTPAEAHPGSHGPNANLISYISHPSSQLAIVTHGTLISEGLVAANLLRAENIFVDVFSVPVVWPFAPELELDSYRFIVVIEEHTSAGGLFSIISEHFAPKTGNRSITSIASQPHLLRVIGSQQYLRKRHGLDGVSVASTIRDLLR